MSSRTTAPRDGDADDLGSASGASSDIPTWKRQSIERSLRKARLRAQEQGDRLVDVAIELLLDRGNTDFTVQDVVDHSRMSARTFYRFFASKDDLLVAVHHTVISTFVVPQMQARCDAEPDPIRRLRAYIEGIFDIVTASLPVARALTVYYHRLQQTRPSDLDAADQPQIDLIVSILRDAYDPDGVGAALDLDAAALLVHRTLLSIVHARLLGSSSAAAMSVEDVWEFCANGLRLGAG